MKTTIISQLVKCIESEKANSPGGSVPSLASTVSFWLSFQHSSKVRKLLGRLLLESLHDSQDAQLMFCENQDNDSGVNFTPSVNSLIVLNVVL